MKTSTVISLEMWPTLIEKSVLKKIKSDFWSHLIIPGSLFCKINTPVHLAVCSKPFFYNCRLPEDTESCFHLCKRKSLMKGGLGFITCLHEVMSTQQVECVCRNSSTMPASWGPSSPRHPLTAMQASLPWVQALWVKCALPAPCVGPGGRTGGCSLFSQFLQVHPLSEDNVASCE